MNSSHFVIRLPSKQSLGYYETDKPKTLSERKGDNEKAM